MHAQGMGRMKVKTKKQKKKKKQFVHMKLKSQSYFLLQLADLLKVPQVDSHQDFVFLQSTVPSCIPWREASPGEASSFKPPLMGSSVLLLTSGFLCRQHGLFLGNLI